MLLGNWKSIVELENTLTLPELEAILKAARDALERDQKFQAALQGIDLGNNDAEERLAAVERRARARLENRDVEEIEFAELGIVVETGD